MTIKQAHRTTVPGASAMSMEEDLSLALGHMDLCCAWIQLLLRGAFAEHATASARAEWVLCASAHPLSPFASCHFSSGPRRQEQRGKGGLSGDHQMQRAWFSTTETTRPEKGDDLSATWHTKTRPVTLRRERTVIV